MKVSAEKYEQEIILEFFFNEQYMFKHETFIMCFTK